MQPRRSAKLKLEIIFNRKVCREVNGDFSINGIIIKDVAVAGCSTEDRKILFKDGATMDQTPIQAADTQEWCVKLWCEGHDFILIPANVIEQIEETLTSKYYA